MYWYIRRDRYMEEEQKYIFKKLIEDMRGNGYSEEDLIVAIAYAISDIRDSIDSLTKLVEITIIQNDELNLDKNPFHFLRRKKS